MNSLHGQVAIVTGGARGIGYAIGEILGVAGCEVIIADILEDEMKRAKEKLSRSGCRCETVPIDVTNEESVRRMVKDVTTTHGRIDILVTSAGVVPNVVPAMSLSISEWDRVLKVNLLGVFLCCREVAGVMAQQQSGKIVNIASLNAVSPAALTVAYNVAKAGVVSLTQTLALELAPFHVRVNAICPGPVGTEFHEILMPQRASTLGISKEEMIERIRSAIPLGRWGLPNDIAKVVLFLASDQSDWITGQSLVVAGGLSAVSASPSKEVILGYLKPSR